MIAFQVKGINTVVAIPFILGHEVKRRVQAICMAALEVAVVADEQIVLVSFSFAKIAVVFGIPHYLIIRIFNLLDYLFFGLDFLRANDLSVFHYSDFNEFLLAERTDISDFGPLLNALMAELM